MTVRIPYSRKKSLLFLPLLFYQCLCSQVPQMSYSAVAISNEKLRELSVEYGVNKQLPKDYSKQVLIALSFFPELKSTRIIFVIRHAHSPLETRPVWSSIFKSTTIRTYIITISDSSMGLLS